MPALRLVQYGPPAATALRDAVIDAKAGDPLAPVTVAVPSNYAGLSLRRSLGSGDLSLAALSGRDGLVNVRFLVLARVAELLGAPSLATSGRRPLTGPVRAEAIRAALASDAGIFRDVAEHAATERSLDATFRDLRRAPPQALDVIAGRSERAADVVRLFHTVRERTADYYDEEDLSLAAADAVRAGSPALRDVGHVVLYLPRRLSPAERALIAALAGEGGLAALVGLTGDPEADEPARRLASQLALGPAGEPEALTPPAGTQIVAVTDAEEEVRAVLRLVTERLAAGTPLHRIAVLYPTVQPYALLAHEQFQAAAVPHNGPAVRTLAQTLSGRTLLGLLRLREMSFRRDAVMDWLSAAPVLERAGGSPAPAHRWDTISRSAGVVGGPGQWRERLAQHGRTLDQKRTALERADDADEWQLRRLTIDIEQLERLERFINELIANVLPGGRTTWGALATWARGLLERYLGGEGHRRDWPLDEVEAHRAVEAACDALAALDDLHPQTDEMTLRRALERELEAPAGRIGRFGDGVFIGRIRDATGADFDTVFVLGMTEGVIPPRARDDPLLPDRERAAPGDEMPLRTARRAEERRDYLAALATARERVLLFPRADLRGQRGKLPAYWLLETASSLEGRSLYSADLEGLARPWHTVVPSFESALAHDGSPASEQEYDLRSLLQWRGAKEPIGGHYLVARTPALSRGLAASIARQSVAFTSWDGHVRATADLAPSADRPLSPTGLQNWAACPYRYFLGHVIRVAETERPEETLRLSAIERGNLIHDALETFIREAPRRTGPAQPWSAGEREHLLAIARRLCDEAEAAGVTGKPLFWRIDRARILRDIRGFPDADEALRRDHGTVPAAVEFSFGVGGAEQPAISVPLAGGRAVTFRGRIDRVDRSPDGARLLVLDYKSGSAEPFRRLAADPIKGGQLLQLPVYALAAQQRFGDVPVKAYYWFVSERWEYGVAGFPLAGHASQLFHDSLAVIVGGIAGGLFPARPGKASNDGFANCRFCPFDRICPRDRGRGWRRKREAAELRDYLDLADED